MGTVEGAAGTGGGAVGTVGGAAGTVGGAAGTVGGAAGTVGGAEQGCPSMYMCGVDIWYLSCTLYCRLGRLLCC